MGALLGTFPFFFNQLGGWLEAILFEDKGKAQRAKATRILMLLHDIKWTM